MIKMNDRRQNDLKQNDFKQNDFKQNLMVMKSIATTMMMKKTMMTMITTATTTTSHQKVVYLFILDYGAPVVFPELSSSSIRCLQFVRNWCLYLCTGCHSASALRPTRDMKHATIHRLPSQRADCWWVGHFPFFRVSASFAWHPHQNC